MPGKVYDLTSKKFPEKTDHLFSQMPGLEDAIFRVEKQRAEGKVLKLALGKSNQNLGV